VRVPPPASIRQPDPLHRAVAQDAQRTAPVRVPQTAPVRTFPEVIAELSSALGFGASTSNPSTSTPSQKTAPVRAQQPAQVRVPPPGLSAPDLVAWRNAEAIARRKAEQLAGVQQRTVT
jgi:hypothetical protein